jgi:predicted porin
MVIIPDDAVGDEIQHVDIGWSGSRFRFTGSEEMDNGNEVGFRFEIQARSNTTGRVDGGTLDTDDGDDFRYQDLYLTADWGKISFGKGDGAANGGTEVDMSGTVLASSSNHQDNWGNFKITAGGRAWKEVFTMFDGLSRQNRVRYDTPNFGGFSFAGSINQGNASELAVQYKGDLFGGKLGAAFFAATAPDIDATTDGNDITGGSASLLLKSGLNFTVAISESEPDVGAESDATTFKVGYKMGKHAFSIDVGEGENGAGEEGDTSGFTWAYFPHPGVEVFAMVRELDSDGVALSESVDLVAFGSRIKF